MKENESLFYIQEVEEMLNPSFLPMIQKFSRRIIERQKSENPSKPIKFFHLSLLCQFEELKGTLKYENVKDKFHLQLRPVMDEEREAEEK